MSTESNTDIELYRQIASRQGFQFEPKRYSDAVAFHRLVAKTLLQLREIPLPYGESAWEPSSAIAWIENTGE